MSAILAVALTITIVLMLFQSIIQIRERTRLRKQIIALVTLLREQPRHKPLSIKTPPRKILFKPPSPEASLNAQKSD